MFWCRVDVGDRGSWTMRRRSRSVCGFVWIICDGRSCWYRASVTFCVSSCVFLLPRSGPPYRRHRVCHRVWYPSPFVPCGTCGWIRRHRCSNLFAFWSVRGRPVFVGKRKIWMISWSVSCVCRMSRPMRIRRIPNRKCRYHRTVCCFSVRRICWTCAFVWSVLYHRPHPFSVPSSSSSSSSSSYPQNAARCHPRYTRQKMTRSAHPL